MDIYNSLLRNFLKSLEKDIREMSMDLEIRSVEKTVASFNDIFLTIFG